MTQELPRREVESADWSGAHEQARADGFTFFDFLSAVDRTDEVDNPGFEIVSHLYRFGGSGAEELFVSTRVDSTQELASLTPIWAGAAWHERETHEMFGVGFAGFEDGTGLGLRPLLLPDDFEGQPLRKDFVLAARVAKAWPGAKEPGESGEGGARGRRRKAVPPGVPDPSWGPR